MLKRSTAQDFNPQQSVVGRLTDDQLEMLVFLVRNTRPMETTCNECRHQLATFVEASLAGVGPAEALRLVEEHLRLCWECREEYETLKAAIEWLDSEDEASG